MSWLRKEELKQAIQEAEECKCVNRRYHLTGDHFEDVKALLNYIEALEKNVQDLLPF